MAGLEVAGWFASPLIDRVLGLAGSFLEQTYGSNKAEVDMLLFDLKISLLSVKGQIEGLEMRPVPSQTLPEWLRELKDAAYEAYDVLDIIEYKSFSAKFNNQSNASVIASPSVSVSKSVIFTDCDLEKLKSVVHKIKTVCSGVNSLIQSLNLMGNETQRIQKRPKKGDTTHHLDNLKVFGRDEEINLILDMMGIPMNNQETSHKDTTREEPEPSNRGEKSRKGESLSNRTVETISENYPAQGVIPIVGIAGVGKTALAKIIYNNKSVIDHFDLKLWVYVPESKDIQTVFRHIIESTESVQPVLGFNAGFDKYRKTFERIITGKRVLLVLDNMWEGDLDWECMRNVFFQEAASGSIILVTTQSQRVANEVGTMTQIRLGVLEPNYFLSLFEHYAFGWASNILDNEKKGLQLIGKKIVEKLNGLPLAAVATASLLKYRLESEHWKNILKSDWWNIGSDTSQVLPSLAISFVHLNNMELRQCFAFCSLIPREIFTINDLIEMWIAHDFIKPCIGQNNNLRGFAIKRFNQLLERCFFQPIIGTDTFYMPDSVRDLAVALSSNEMYIIKNEKIHVPRTVRHLTLFSDAFSNIEWGEFNMEKLRTLLVYCHLKKEDYHILKTTLSKSTNLRVLDLSHINLEKEPPHAISSLLHLRSLNLAYTGIEVFPNSFCRLFHLRVLNLKGCQLGELPKEFNQLTNLQFLHADHTIISGIYGIGKLTKLQSLSRFTVRNKEGFKLSELKEMNEIDDCLRIENLNEVSDIEEAIDARLTDKKFLRRLEFVWGSPLNPPQNDLVIFERLKPHTNIEELVIDNYGGDKFLGWMVEFNSFTNLHFICLRHSKLVELPILGELPSLAVLNIETLDYITHIDERIYGNDTEIFPSLKELSFLSMSNWEEWSGAPVGQLITGLKKLSVTNCKKLKGIPFQSLGPSVIELEISNCGSFVNEMCLSFDRLTALTTLKISMCEQRISIPCNNLRTLEYLCLDRCSHVYFDMQLKSLIKLKKLELLKCRIDESVVAPSLELPPSLICFQMDDLRAVRGYYIGLRILPSSLRVLKICRHSGFKLFDEAPSLEELEISQSYFAIPEISSLHSLKKLTIRECDDVMRSLFCFRLPRSLKELHIIDCPKERMDRFRRGGAEWGNIAHIPYIRVDGETIQML